MARRQPREHQPVDQAGGDVRSGQCPAQRDEEQREPAQPGLDAGRHGPCQQTQRQCSDTAQVNGSRLSHAPTQAPLLERGTKSGLPFEAHAAGADQVVAGIVAGFAGIGRITEGGHLGHHPLGDFQFRMGRTPGEFLDGMPIAVSGQEVHHRMAAMATQALFHQTHLFHELAPVECGEGAHAGDDIADGGIGGDLVGVFPVHDIIKGDTPFGQPVVQKVQGRRRARMRVVQSLGGLHGVSLAQGQGGQDAGRRRRSRRRLVGPVGGAFEFIDELVSEAPPSL